ncbi:hypothetical protein Ntsu_10190 [Nocardia sp. IFM 10818]
MAFAVTVPKRGDPLQDRLTALALRVRLLDRLDQRVEFRHQLVDLLGGALELAGHLPHEVFVAVRPVGSDDPFHPLQPGRKLQSHSAPQLSDRRIALRCTISALSEVQAPSEYRLPRAPFDPGSA